MQKREKTSGLELVIGVVEVSEQSEKHVVGREKTEEHAHVLKKVSKAPKRA